MAPKKRLIMIREEFVDTEEWIPEYIGERRFYIDENRKYSNRFYRRKRSRYPAVIDIDGSDGPEGKEGIFR